MYEYKFKTIEEVIKLYTPAQIRQLIKFIDKRNVKEMKKKVMIQHTPEPQKLIDDLSIEEDIMNKQEEEEDELEDWM